METCIFANCNNSIRLAFTIVPHTIVKVCGQLPMKYLDI